MESLNGRRSQIHAAFLVGFFSICVGIPFWWKATEVYRADLPFADIQNLAENVKISTKITLKIVSHSKKLTEIASDSFKNVLAATETPYIDADFSIASETVTEKAFESLTNEVSNGEIVPETDALIALGFERGLELPKIVVSHKKLVSVKVLPDATDLDLENAIRKAAKLIKEKIFNIKSIDDVVSKAYGARTDFPTETEFHMMKTVRPDRGYDLLFSLLCPEPDKLLASWDIKAATSLYLKPMLGKLGSFASFDIASQVLYYSSLSLKPKHVKTGENANFYLTQQQLPHVVNPIESRLGAQMSPNPTLNFVIYIPKEKYNPLRIKLQNGTLSKTNAFLVPRWGAIMIKNTEKSNSSAGHPRKIHLESSEYMEIFLAQLRSLLGLETLESDTDLDVNVEQAAKTFITDLEVDYLIRARVAENIATSVHTLHSLAQLLEKIQNIVINDKIAEHVFAAVNQIRKAKRAFLNSELREALNHSNAAFKASETAFFDQTLLELLYFPEDQKFAIYIPLFLPISLPLLGSLLNAFKQRKLRTKEAKQRID